MIITMKIIFLLGILLGICLGLGISGLILNYLLEKKVLVRNKCKNLAKVD